MVQEGGGGEKPHRVGIRARGGKFDVFLPIGLDFFELPLCLCRTLHHSTKPQSQPTLWRPSLVSSFVQALVAGYACVDVERSLIDAALELVEVEEARGDGVSVEDPSFEGVDGLHWSIHGIKGME